jgi:subtilisin-like proprotein convertase family protein
MRILTAAFLLVTACTTFEVAGDPEILFASRNPSAPLPDDSVVGVTDIAQIEQPCTIDSTEVDVEIRHQYRGDIFAHLTSPSGTILVLKNATDDDESLDLVGTFPTTLMPFQPLSFFDGEDGMGGWTLKVGDLGTGDTGTFEAWTIRLGCY